MVARGGAAQQRNPGKDAKYIGTPFRGGIMRGFNIYSYFPFNTIDNKRTTTCRKPFCHPSGVPIDGWITRGSAAQRLHPGLFYIAPQPGLRIRLAALAVNSSFGIRPSKLSPSV